MCINTNCFLSTVSISHSENDAFHTPHVWYFKMVGVNLVQSACRVCNSVVCLVWPAVVSSVFMWMSLAMKRRKKHCMMGLFYD